MKYIILLTIFYFNSLLATDSLTFKLNSKLGVVTQENFQDKYLLVAIGYTSCPDICPTTMIDMKGALQYLDKVSTLSKEISPLFITIDPTSDSLKNIITYASYFDERILGLRADNFEILDDVIKQLRASYGYIKDGKPVFQPNLPTGYTVFHSTYIYLYSPKRRLIDVFSYNLGGDELGKRIYKILSKWLL